MNKGGKEIVRSIALLILLTAASWFVSLGIVRGCAIAFADPNPYQWEWVYVSTSPRAYSFHQSMDCEYLRKTTHKIDLVSVYDADDDGKEPCSLCLEKSKRHQYDNAALYVTPFVMMMLVGVIVLVERLFKNRK